MTFRTTALSLIVALSALSAPGCTYLCEESCDREREEREEECLNEPAGSCDEVAYEYLACTQRCHGEQT